MNVRTTRYCLAVLLAVAGALATMNTAHAQWNLCPPQLITCNYIPGPIVIGLPSGATLQGVSSGTGTFAVTLSAGGNGAQSEVRYVPSAINATSNFNGFPQITTSLDPNGASVTSSTVGPTGGGLYPAVSSMAFPARAVVGGNVYTSVGPVILQAQGVNSFAPFTNEPFQLQQPVQFRDAAGNLGFTLLQLNATFNN